MTPAEIITLRAPALDAAYAARIPDLITLAEEQTGQAYGDHRNLAVALLVLHWLAIEQRGAAAAAGGITSEREGDLARSYGGAGGTLSGDLAQTTWGLELLRLRNSTIFAARNRMMTPL